jgi:hypothetical protein
MFFSPVAGRSRIATIESRVAAANAFFSAFSIG